MDYVYKGQARMTILDIDGTRDIYELKPGDCYFIPRAYPHQIETVGTDDIHFLIFFDQTTSGDIGYRASATALSRSVLAATFGVTDAELPSFPRHRSTSHRVQSLSGRPGLSLRLMGNTEAADLR